MTATRFASSGPLPKALKNKIGLAGSDATASETSATPSKQPPVVEERRRVGTDTEELVVAPHAGYFTYATHVEAMIRVVFRSDRESLLESPVVCKVVVGAIP